MTGEFETFHDVRVSDAAIEEWLGERWLHVGAGYPNRPPDYDGPTARGWVRRPGDHVHTASVLIDDVRNLIAFFRTERFPAIIGAPRVVDEVVARARRAWALDSTDPRPYYLEATIKGAIERIGALFRARLRLHVELLGVVKRDEAVFASEVEARDWLVQGARDLTAWVDLEEAKLDLVGLPGGAPDAA